MSHRRRKLTSALLLFFAVWDLILAAAAIAFPEQWFDMFHGEPHVDPQALLARTGAIWVAFSLFHLVAFLTWRTRPYWLVIVGGMRLGEIFADWTYAFMADSVTTGGWISLLLAGATNLLFAVFFIRGFLLETRPGPVEAVRGEAGAGREEAGARRVGAGTG